MKKRLLSILLCCAMAVSMMTGCGNVDSEELAKSQAAASGTETTTAATEESSEGEKQQLPIHSQLRLKQILEIHSIHLPPQTVMD